MPELRPEELYRELKNGQLRPVYWLAGENAYERNKAADAIRAAVKPDEFNLDVFYGDSDSGSAVVQAASSLPTFADSRLVLVRRATGFKTDDREAIAEYLQNPLASTCLVLVAGSAGEVSGRRGGKAGTSLPKLSASAGASVTFELPKERDVQDFARKLAVQHKLVFAPQALDTLAEACGSDMHALENEIAKLALYRHGAKGEVSPQDVLNSLGFSHEENPFALTNALGERDGLAAARIIDRSIAAGDEPIAMLAMVAKYVEQMLKIKRMLGAGMSEGQIASELGFHPYRVKMLASQSRAYADEKTLFGALYKILEADSQLKSSSAEPAPVLKSIVLALTGVPRSR
jgi:DNA polymerase-3 subunit delta